MVPLQAFVTYATAFATPRDPFHRYGVLVGTNAAMGSHPLVGLTVLVVLWMDDFDANTALSKLNRTSLFAAVATVLLVEPTGSLVAAYSNLICNMRTSKKRRKKQSCVIPAGDSHVNQ
jgi:hypothetical protein